MGDDITSTTLNILNNNEDPHKFKHTFINLIPKTKNPIKPTDFIPITLCNAFMKIITKAVSNRIKLILHVIISENQSAFVHKRLIINNTMIAYDMFNLLNKTNKRMDNFVGIKMDMEKAYEG